MLPLEGKTILIVGGAQGIGGATAELCAARGAQMIIADRDDSAGRALASSLNAIFCTVDVTSEPAVQNVFAQIRANHGKLDVLIQTAGVLRGPYVPIEEFDLAMFRNVLDVNVVGSFLCAKYAVPLLRQAGRGVIVLVSSLAAINGSSSYAYGTSKGGVDALGITLAAKHATDNIRVNVVRPGNISTAMKRSVIEEDARRRGESVDKLIDESALGDPNGIAQVLAWLASDEADYVRGALNIR